MIFSKLLRITFDNVNRSIRVYDGTRDVVLFGTEKYDAIYNRIRYLISLKGDTTYVDSHDYARIKINSCDSLPLEKTLTFHNVIIMLIRTKITTTIIYF